MIQRILDLNLSGIEIEAVVRTVTSNRETDRLRKELEEKQKNCDHDWRYEGHGHNEDFYECAKCGLGKFE